MLTIWTCSANAQDQSGAVDDTQRVVAQSTGTRRRRRQRNRPLPPTTYWQLRRAVEDLWWLLENTHQPLTANASTQTPITAVNRRVFTERPVATVAVWGQTTALRSPVPPAVGIQQLANPVLQPPIIPRPALRPVVRYAGVGRGTILPSAQLLRPTLLQFGAIPPPVTVVTPADTEWAMYTHSDESADEMWD